MTIKEKVIQLRENNISLRTLLGTVLGEMDRVSKTPTDEQSVQIIKKMIESLSLIDGIKEKEEAFVLSQFLPSQMDELDIQNILDFYKFNSIGECMKHFKEHHNNFYDGKLVSKLYTQLNKK